MFLTQAKGLTIRTMTYPTLLGAAGWDRPEWAVAFYPGEMPEEWRLTYYSTQFHCVFLPADTWLKTTADDFAAWAADTHEQFVFLLEGASPGDLPPRLAGRAIGLARDDPRLLWFDRDTSLKSLAGQITGHTEVTYLLSSDGDLGQIERVRTLLELLGR